METPPLTRGRHQGRGRGGRPPGNTPAYAGKTGLAPLSGRTIWKHPRLRGEDGLRIVTEVMTPETPPLTRGRLRVIVDRKAGARNTPAYAGKTVPTFASTVAVTETPPLTRGRPLVEGQKQEKSRNTPAYAGKTLQYAAQTRESEKHPRLRGEDRDVLAFF